MNRSREASAQPELSSARLENGPLRRTLSSTCLGGLEIIFTQQLFAEDKVRFVLDRQRGRIVALDPAGTVQILPALLLVAVPQQCNPQIVRTESFQTFLALQVFQNGDGLGIATVGHGDIRAQKSQVGADRCGNGAADAFDSMQCIFRLVFLEVHPGQAENGLVAH